VTLRFSIPKKPSMAAMRARMRRLLAALLACVPTAGCVQRRFTIRSNPPGRWRSSTITKSAPRPFPHDFVYYGKRKIQLVKDGYEER